MGSAVDSPRAHPRENPSAGASRAEGEPTSRRRHQQLLIARSLRDLEEQRGVRVKKAVKVRGTTNRRWAGFSSLKGHTVAMLRFVGHAVSVAMTPRLERDQRRCVITCVPIKLYLQKQVVGQIWPTGCRLP